MRGRSRNKASQPRILFTGLASLKLIRTIAALRRLRRLTTGPVVLVPTMGALHAGHTALIDRARRLAGSKGLVVVSIFVNPTQFGPKEDLSRYPRTLPEDRRLCAAHRADVIFYPTVGEMYPEGFSTFVEEHTVSATLCGASRQGHFRGVCTVVLKLFNIVQPDLAVFGLKDYQQCAVIRRMVGDFDLGIRIVGVPIVRETDGLALSSRNRYLSSEERAQAPTLRRALLATKAAWRDGEINTSRLRQKLVQELHEAPLARLDYAELVEANSLRPVTKISGPTTIAIAVYFGTTRLIDNLLIG